jgi:bifunctional UDP-N-acetylglucosamine pyrophosphorylase / glucosamine-1-phosphate N-acetyltransferase
MLMSNSEREVAVVVLGAGKGTRMQSDLPKVLQPLKGKPLISHLLKSIDPLNPDRCVVVVGPGMDDVKECVAPHLTAVQESQLGTGDAVKAARDMLEDFHGDVLVVFGDTPLITTQTLQRIIAERNSEANPAVVVLGFRPEDPLQYGRLKAGANGELTAIVEYVDCDEALKASNLCNSGVMAFDGQYMFELLDAITSENSKGEYYLTDVVAIAKSKGLHCAFVEGNPKEVLGINTKAELAEVESMLA